MLFNNREGVEEGRSVREARVRAALLVLWFRGGFFNAELSLVTRVRNFFGLNWDEATELAIRQVQRTTTNRSKL